MFVVQQAGGFEDREGVTQVDADDVEITENFGGAGFATQGCFAVDVAVLTGCIDRVLGGSNDCSGCKKSFQVAAVADGRLDGMCCPRWTLLVGVECDQRRPSSPGECLLVCLVCECSVG